jgi:putative transposase
MTAALSKPSMSIEDRTALGILHPKIELKRARKFRLYPTKIQEAELAEWTVQLRRLWNLAHEQRMASLLRHREWEFVKGKCPSCGVQVRWDSGDEHEPPKHTASCDYVDYFRQSKEMTALLSVDDQLARVVCSARQEILRDLDKAWQRWRKKLGGRPRFKRRTDQCRIYLSTPKHWSIKGKYLELSGSASSVGQIRIELDQPWPEGATFSSCAIVRDVDHWYATFPLTFTADVAKAPHRSVGINRGAIHAIADSDGRVIDSPRFYVRRLPLIHKRSRKLKRCVPGSRRYHVMAEKLAKTYRKVRWQRGHFLHQESARYAANYDLVAIEDMSVKEMLEVTDEDRAERPNMPWNKLHRSILDVGWYEFGRQLSYKSPAHGGELRKVDPGQFSEEARVSDEHDPKGISSACAECGKPLDKPASGRRWARCEACERKQLGDLGAAENVLQRAMAMKPPSPRMPKASIKIKGRQKRSVTAPNRGVAGRGGYPPVRGPNESSTLARMVGPGPDT